MFRNMAQHPVFEVRSASPGVENLTGQRIGVYGVHGEIPTRRRFFENERRIAFRRKGAMSETELGLPPRQRNVDVEMFELYHAERRADEIKLEFAAQNPDKFFSAQTVAFEIIVSGVCPQKRIAHAAADEQRPAAGFPDAFGERQRRLRQIGEELIRGFHVTPGRGRFRLKRPFWSRDRNLSPPPPERKDPPRHRNGRACRL